MAKMVPPHIDRSSSSPGEVFVFDVLSSSPETSDWMVLHSYDLPRNTEMRRHELDFIVIVPGLGICAIEVKAHLSASVSTDGVWQLGSQPPTKKSPPRQALDACYALKRFIEPWLAKSPKVAPLLVFTSAEVPALPELDLDCQLSPREGSVGDLLIQKILASIKTGSGSLLSEEEAATVRSRLRPSFEVLASPKERSALTKRDLLSATTEQIQILDAIGTNPRILIEGAPGSGKTLLAVEAARRARIQGQSVRMLCFNHALGLHLRTEADEMFEASSLYGFLVRKLEESPPANPDTDYWASLAERAVAAITEADKVELLVVDEYQDLVDRRFLPILDALVIGGLSQGRWVLAGDAKHQQIQSESSTHSDEYRARAVTVTLTKNCRNLRSHGEWIEKISGYGQIFQTYLRQVEVDPPETLFMDEDDFDQRRALIKKVQKAFPSREIVILTRNQDRAARWISECGLAKVGSAIERPVSATYRTFKGLEAPAVIVETCLQGAADEFITACTRATEELIVILPPSDVSEFFARSVAE
jgi:hypothetical protein